MQYILLWVHFKYFFKNQDINFCYLLLHYLHMQQREVRPTIHFYCVLHSERFGPNNMQNCVRNKWKARYFRQYKYPIQDEILNIITKDETHLLSFPLLSST